MILNGIQVICNVVQLYIEIKSITSVKDNFLQNTRNHLCDIKPKAKQYLVIIGAKAIETAEFKHVFRPITCLIIR